VSGHLGRLGKTARSRNAGPRHQPRLVLDNSQARRLVLSRLGLLGAPAAAEADPDSVHRTVSQLGFVQLDSLQVVERAHHHIIFARHPAYRPELLTTLFQEQRRLFEHWTHDASLIPIEFFPHWRHRYARAKLRIAGSKWWLDRLGDGKQVAAIRRHVRREGLTRARDLETAGEQRSSWWGWSPAKAALEYLWFTGELAVVGRDRFEKVYDLMERVIPAKVQATRVLKAASLQWACQGALDRLGVATVPELAAFWELFDRDEVAAWARRGLAAGRLIEVAWTPFDGGPPRTGLAAADLAEGLGASDDEEGEVTTIRALAPFDPLVRDRQRALRLFGFDYRIEVYTPRHQRQYGYYVFPLLEGDRLIGRVDLKADRAADQLRVQGLWLEPGVKLVKARQRRLDAELERVAQLARVSRVEMASEAPGPPSGPPVSGSVRPSRSRTKIAPT
jgi:uncharacterized protein YcaQ